MDFNFSFIRSNTSGRILPSRSFLGSPSCQSRCFVSSFRRDVTVYHSHQQNPSTHFSRRRSFFSSTSESQIHFNPLQYLSSLFLSLDPLTFTFPPSVLTRLLAKNHDRYNSLTQQCDAYLYLDYHSGTLSVYGEERQRQMAKVMILDISHNRP